MTTMLDLPDGSTIDYDNEKAWLNNVMKTGDAHDSNWAQEQLKYYDSILAKTNIEKNPDVPNINPETPEYPDLPEIDPYDSSYKDLIEASMSDILNYDDFQYDPKKDPSYQAYLNQMTTLGEEAFTNSLATMSSATGGRPNSWSQTVATQQQNKYLSEASANMAQFEGLAYQKYLDKYNMSMDKLNTLINMDDISYNRYRDSVNDKYQRFEYEVNRYHEQLDEIQREIDRAWDRTNTLGYVTNEDSAILGVAPGTPSQELMLMKEEYDYYLKELDERMKKEEERAKADFAREKELLNLKYDLEYEFLQDSLELQASYDGGSGDDDGEDASLTPSEMRAIKKELNKTLSLVDAVDPLGEQEWSMMNNMEKIGYISDIEDEIYSEWEHSDQSPHAEQILLFKLDMLHRKDSYHDLYKPYIDEQAEKNALGITAETRLDFLRRYPNFDDLDYKLNSDYENTTQTEEEEDEEEELEDIRGDYNAPYPL